MEFKDYYKVLEIDRTATADDIKSAYRKLARKYHPDVSKETQAEAHFKEIGEAYEVLQDPEKRAAYDQLGNRWREGQEFTPPPEWGGGLRVHLRRRFRGGCQGLQRLLLHSVWQLLSSRRINSHSWRGPSCQDLHYSR
jgi:curved DNA-binding protein